MRRTPAIRSALSIPTSPRLSPNWLKTSSWRRAEQGTNAAEAGGDLEGDFRIPVQARRPPSLRSSSICQVFGHDAKIVCEEKY